jgi:protein associated with RNAse G/E
MLFLYIRSKAGMTAMAVYRQCIVKSFKYDGHLHRMWLRNWLIPARKLVAEHARDCLIVLINDQTPIREADGKSWISRVPAVSFFIPGEWFNVVALLETSGIRYYCNIASPPYMHNDVLTYIDYDLDVIRLPDGTTHVVDRDEYEAHRALYQYPAVVEEKAAAGLEALKKRIRDKKSPFDDEIVQLYYNSWKKDENEV